MTSTFEKLCREVDKKKKAEVAAEKVKANGGAKPEMSMTDMDDVPSTAEAVDNLINMTERRNKLREGIRREDFIAYLPMHNYIYMPTREAWPGSSVNAVLLPVQISKDKSIAASTWIDRNQAVEQMTWAPGHDELIHDYLISGGGWIERTGAR